MVFLKVVKTLRNNWKKSVFFAGAVSYGAHLLNTKLKINNLMKAYCEEAVKFGSEALDPFTTPRHVTIILNPVSKDKKCKNLYEKYVSPLFHCAGLKVSVVQTEAEREARGLMAVMSNTDAVVIVGGNGTVHDSITGLLRRDDADFVTQSMPIGVIPISKQIFAFSQLFDIKKVMEKEGKKVGEVRLLAEAAMAVIRETVKNVDVIKIEGKEMGKPVFAMNSFDFGLLNDMAKKADKYWYYGSSLKPYYPLVKGTLLKSTSSLTIPMDVNVLYTEPCSGCSKCYQKFSTPNLPKVNEVIIGKRWWHSFIPRQLGSQPKQQTNKEKVTVDYSKIINDNCGVWKSLPKENILNLSINNSLKEGKMNLVLHFTDGAKKTEIVKEGKEDLMSNISQRVEAENIKIEFAGTTNDESGLINSNVSVNNENNASPKEEAVVEKDHKLWFRIDNEDYEPQNVEITLIPKKIRVYC